MPLRVQLTMHEVPDAITPLADRKAVVPDGIPVKLFEVGLNGDHAP